LFVELFSSFTYLTSSCKVVLEGGLLLVEEEDEEGLSTSRYLGDIRIHHLTRGSIQTTMIGEAFSVVAKAILDAIPRFEVLQMMMMKAVWSSLDFKNRRAVSTCSSR
jgi:hypothetical protein